jgi:HAE1 family hydrophobic/amphiphilic exporter-1
VLLALGRTLNVVSLAGLAFAVGMVVDNAIVVLENIYRRIQQEGDRPMRRGVPGRPGGLGRDPRLDAHHRRGVHPRADDPGGGGAAVPRHRARDRRLGRAVAGRVDHGDPRGRSRWLRTSAQTDASGSMRGPSRLDRCFGGLVSGFANWVYWCMGGWRGWTIRPLVILGLTAASLGGARLLAPPLDYLPAGNRNLVFGGLLIPPGLSVE